MRRILLLFPLLLAGCPGMAGPLGWTGATPEQLRALVADKAAAVTCIRGVYAGALVTVVAVNADLGVAGTVTVDESCKTVYTAPAAPVKGSP